jgi:hypothetical protein
MSVDEFMDRFHHVALCRNLQILAAFSFLTKVKGKPHFAQYIIPAWRGLRRLLAEPPCWDYQLLADLVQRQSDGAVARVAASLEREAQHAAGSNAD